MATKKMFIEETVLKCPQCTFNQSYSKNVDNICNMCHFKYDSQSIEKHFAETFPFDPSQDVIVNARHADLLSKAASSLTSVTNLLNSTEGIEIVLHELNHCRSHIDEIIGTKTNEDVLDLLFKKFCIGK